MFFLIKAQRGVYKRHFKNAPQRSEVVIGSRAREKLPHAGDSQFLACIGEYRGMFFLCYFTEPYFPLNYPSIKISLKNFPTTAKGENEKMMGRILEITSTWHEQFMQRGPTGAAGLTGPDICIRVKFPGDPDAHPGHKPLNYPRQPKSPDSWLSLSAVQRQIFPRYSNSTTEKPQQVLLTLQRLSKIIYHNAFFYPISNTGFSNIDFILLLQH